MASIRPYRISTNAIGYTGELLAQAHLSRPVMRGYNRPLFRPTHLGEKCPIVDLLVDILDAKENSLGFFFVQVKSTSKATVTRTTLSLTIELVKYNKLASIPAPTFLMGVDTEVEKTYVIAARRRAHRLASITKSFDLTDESIRIRLYKEVKEYWKTRRGFMRQALTGFQNGR